MAIDIPRQNILSEAQGLRQQIEMLEAELRTAKATIRQFEEQNGRSPASESALLELLQESESQDPADILAPLHDYRVGEGVDENLFRSFMRMWFHRLEEIYRERRRLETLLKQFESMFRFVQSRSADDILARVFVPTLESDGYHLSCTVVEICLIDQPFILDTLRMLFQERGLLERACISTVMHIERDDGEVVGVTSQPTGGGSGSKEAFLHWELEPLMNAEESEVLLSQVRERLALAWRIVKDYRRILRRIVNLSGELRLLAEEFPARYDQLDAVASLLNWLRNDRFVFMSYERFELRETSDGLVINSDALSRLGLRSAGPARGLPDSAKQWITTADVLYIGKKTLQSTVHRRGKLDVILVKSLDQNGHPNQIHLISGLFTRKALGEPGGSIPVLQEKLRALLLDEAVVNSTYLQRSITIAFNSMPLEYLFGVEVSDLRQVIREIMGAESRREAGVFFKHDPTRAAAFVLVSIPRDRYSNELKDSICDHLRKVFGATYQDHREVFGQHGNVLVYLYLTAERQLKVVEDSNLKTDLHQLTRTWEEMLFSVLAARTSEEEARSLTGRYAFSLPARYQADTSPAAAADDIGMFSAVERTGRMQCQLSQDSQGYVLRIFESQLTQLTVSLPILSFLGFNVASETAFEITLPDRKTLYLSVFRVAPATELKYSLLERVENIRQALAAIFEQRIENDRLNQLILLADVNWRLVDVLRAYIQYNRQLVSQSPLDFYRQVCLTHNDAARLLIQLFEARFDPHLAVENSATRAATVDTIREAFLDRLKLVDISSEDKVLRNLFTLIEATVRTNFYRDRSYLSFKFDPSRIDQMAEPRPFREIFVHHPEVEGVHLRGGPIARGGLRWSDRYDDYRLEVLGLMTTQQVKNVVIVPVGSKGGFILKRRYTDRKFERQEADRLYEIFISGLLDVTDNIMDGRPVAPDNVVRWDLDDPYLVVAADKGTAHLSNTANRLSLARDFWLGDAFASGGSNGYDHKELAITSRGAWVSVQRHFLEVGMNPEKDVISCVGIGDMAGDVFGNGLLRSRTIRLVGAFNHMHIFLDPNPDPEKSFQERLRLFHLSGSSWDDYSRECLSSGGGIYKRTAKAIPLSPEVKGMLGVTTESLSGDEVMQLLLRLNVDLLWNGGIGTYVKASGQTHMDVGDRVNDAVRADATEVRAKVVAEGGNLGLTMAARLEFAARGGKLNTDAVDNSGGVDTSDHEVNLKILFEPLCRRGAMTYDQRNEVLRRLSDEVCALVLTDNYCQNLLLSLDERRSLRNLRAFERLVDFLEKAQGLNRGFEGVPTATEFHERRSQGKGLYRPELSKIMAYTKMYVYNKLLQDPRFQGTRVDEALRKYFPKEVVERFEQHIPDHPLKKEIAATYLCNRIIDGTGCTFFYNIWEDASYEPTETAFAYLLVNELLDAGSLKDQIRALEGTYPAEALYQALIQIEDLLALITRRVLRRNFEVHAPDNQRERLQGDFRSLRADLISVLPRETHAECEKRADELLRAGLPAELAREVALYPEYASGADIALLKAESGFDLKACAWLYHQVGQELGLRKALNLAANSSEESDWWGKSAMSLLRAKLVDLQYQVSLEISRRSRAADGIAGLGEKLEAFKQERSSLLERVKGFERRLQWTPGSQGVAPMVVLSSILEELAAIA